MDNWRRCLHDDARKLPVMTFANGIITTAPTHSQSKVSRSECIVAVDGNLTGKGGLSYKC